jgi:hypothetical protein
MGMCHKRPYIKGFSAKEAEEELCVSCGEICDVTWGSCHIIDMKNGIWRQSDVVSVIRLAVQGDRHTFFWNVQSSFLTTWHHIPEHSAINIHCCVHLRSYGSGLIFWLTGTEISCCILCLWFHTSLVCSNNCPTRCNTKQSIYYSASSLYMFRVSTTPIIRSTQNFNYSLRYCAATSLQRGQACLVTLEGGSCTKNMTSTGGCSYSFVYCWWWAWLTPETCRVNLQNNKQTALCCILLDSY